MAWWIRLRALPLWVIPLILGILILFLPVLGLDYAIVRQLQLTLILALVVSGLNLTLGYAGELGLGQAAMFAAGAYTAGIISKLGQSDLIIELVAAAIAALVIGIVTGIPGLRLGGWSLAMTSFFLVLLLPDILTIFQSSTGGSSGLSGIVPPTLLGVMLTQNGIYIATGVIAILWFAVLRNIVVSRHGIAFRVLKQSPVLASSLGISVFRTKLLAYAIGAVPAGLAGALFANLDLYISPDAFDFTFATTVLAASVLGGSASIYGAVVGAAILQFGANQSTAFQQYGLLFTGGLLVLGGVLLTGGLAGVFRSIVARLDARAKSDVVVAPDTLSDAEYQFPGKALTITGVSKSFGGNVALKDVSLTASPGKVTAVIGPNGSGKTTLLNMICGFYRTDAGRIDLGGIELQSSRPHVVARAGIARTFQTPNIPDGITVFDAVIAGRYTAQRASLFSAIFRTPRFRRVRTADREEAESVLALVGLSSSRDAIATSLPLGMRRMLEVARCLIARPGLLLLDEVASGLDEHEIERLDAIIRKVVAGGGTVIVVEHNFQLVLNIADEIVALAHGEVMAKGSPAEIESNPRVMSEYLGVDAEELAKLAEVASHHD
jgi:branched-chain amino acid transport system permease protein